MDEIEELVGIDVLLDLDGEIFFEDNGYWYKIEAKRVQPDDHRPHGILYCLTLHNNYNERILGYDNAHAVKQKRTGKSLNSRIVKYDHKHENYGRKELVKPYDFKSPEKLMRDFFVDVTEIIKGSE